MPPVDEDTLRRVVNEVLDKRRGVDEFTHRTHHEQFKEVNWQHLGYMVKRDKDRRDRRDKLKTQIIGGVVVSALISYLGFMFWAIGHWVKSGGQGS